MLDFRLVDVLFNVGLDKKTDENIIAKLETLDNCVFGDSNTISKGGGYAAVSGFAALDGNAITAGKRLATRKDELLIETESSLHSLLRGSTEGYVRRSSNFGRVSATVTDLVRPPGAGYYVYGLDAAVATDGLAMSCWAWMEGNVDGTWKLLVSVYDEETGGAYLSRHELGTTTAGQFVGPRVVAGPQSFIIVWIGSGGTIGYNTINYAAPATVSARTVWYTDADPGSNSTCIDAFFSDDRVYFAYGYWTAGSPVGFKVAKTLQADYATIDTSRLVNDVNHTPAYGLSLTQAADGTLVVATADGLTIRACSIPDAMASDAKLLIDTVTTPARVTALAVGLQVLIVYDQLAATPDTTSRVMKVMVTTAPAIAAGPTTVMRGMSVASKAFKNVSRVLVLAQYSDELSPTTFLLDCGTDASSSDIRGAIARVIRDEAGIMSDAVGHVPGVFTVNEVTTIPAIRRGDLVREGTLDVTPRGLSRIDVNLGDAVAAPLQRLEFGGSTFFAGALPLVYDGVNVFEAGFNYPPDDDGVTLTDAGVGSMSAGDYQASVVWEFYDATGRRWQSVPSVPKSITLGAGRRLTVSAPTYRMTRMQDAGGVVRVVVYLTEANGTVLYRGASGANSTTADTVSISYNMSDTDLIGNEVLYTTGGALEYEAYPAHRVSCVHQNRYVMAGLEDPFAVQFTDELVDHEAPATNAAYRFQVPPDKGWITAIKSSDDKLIIWCERGIWFVYGQGPNLTGSGGTYSPAQTVVSEIGCAFDSPDSVVLVPDGVWFRSEQGLRFLTRGLAVARDEAGMYLGAEVDEYATACVAAVPVPEKSMVRFYTGAVALCYDYQWRQWSRFENHAAVDATVWAGALVHMRSNGTLYEAGGFDHAGTEFSMTATTGWIKLAGINGFQRVQQLVLLGRKFTTTNANSGFLVYAGWNYSGTLLAYTQAEMADYAVADTGFQFRSRLPIQKCTAIRFSLVEFWAGAATNVENFRLTGFSLLVGVKKGAAKLRTSHSG